MDTNSNNSNIVSTNSSMNLDDNETFDDEEGDDDETLDEEELSETEYDEDELGDEENADEDVEDKNKSCGKKVKSEAQIYETNPNGQFFGKLYKTPPDNQNFQHPNHNSMANIPLVDFYHYF